MDAVRGDGHAVESICWGRRVRRTVSDTRASRPGELIHHSDAGSRHTASRFTEHLPDASIAPSIGTVGNEYDCETGGWRLAA